MGIFSLLLIGGIGYGLMRQLKKMQREQLQAIRRDSLPPGTTPAQIIDVQAFPAPTPVAKKGLNKYAVMALCLLYLAFPLDFIPDFLPVIGWGDDLAAAVIGLRAMLVK